MKSLMFFVAVLFSLSNVSHAECTAAYKSVISGLEGKMNPPRTTVIANAVGEGALVGSIAAISGTVAATAVLALPVAAVGAGTYWGILVARRDGWRNAMHVIRDAQKGSGKELERFLKKLGKKADSDFSREAVINFIVHSDIDNAFCVQSEKTDKYDLFSFQEMVKYTAKKLEAGEI